MATWRSILLLSLLTCLPAGAQTEQGVAFLVGAQGADGSWTSGQVRRVQATSEVLATLQALGQAPAARSAAAGLLESAPLEDSEDRARRIVALAAEGRPVATLVNELLAHADPEGGWGLNPSFVADPLDTALALSALSSQPAAGDEIPRRALLALGAAQRQDGGWACVASAEAESEIFCTSQALLALVSYRGRYFFDPQIEAAKDFLRGQLNADGSFGPAGTGQVIHTALASLALAAVPAFGSEVVTVTAFLSNRQQADGSWEGDPYATALALRSLKALAAVPYCGDGAVNRPGEACDGGVPPGLTCQGVGMGSGTLACSPQCTLDTSGCSAPPVCGDNLRNQPFEICDGNDLAAQTCQSQGFTGGTLRCAADCLSFNVGLCTAAPRCGDGVVNQPGEACDLSDLKQNTCQSLGLGGGLLQCTSDCNLDTSLCAASSLVIDNKGREFFFGFLTNIGVPTLQLHLTSDVPTSVNVQFPVNSPTFSQTVSVTPGQVTVVSLPEQTHSGWTAGRVLNNAVRASAPDDFVAYLVNRYPASSDAGMALPVDALGTSYILTMYRGPSANYFERNQFLVIAPFAGTTVTITPTATLRIPFPGSDAPPNVPFQIRLERGQGFRGEALLATADLTGTLIESDQPVAVLNGNLCANIPPTAIACDHIFEVAHPVRSWGTSAVVANLPDRPAGSIYRVVASVDGTAVTLDGVLQTTLDRGKFVQVGPLPGNHLFAANHPIFVTQFMTGVSSPGATEGDPDMANMIPPDQYLSSYTFSTVGGSQFNRHFLTVIAPDAAIGQLTLDGTPVPADQFSAIAGTGFSAAILPLAEGAHTTASPLPHGITVEGMRVADSYVYPGGARLESINQFCGDGSANRETEQCDGTDFRGATCTSFGFASGLLRCTADCRTDTSQCSGLAVKDEDDDGFPANRDCNDRDPEVSPGMPEIPGNGVDDDCNPATPDVIPQGALACDLGANQNRYTATDLVFLAAAARNQHPSFTLTGLSAALSVRSSAGVEIFSEVRPLAPLPPGARQEQNFLLSAAERAPGNYVAELRLSHAGASLASCPVSFTIESSDSTGAGLVGDLVLNPSLVNAGDPSNAQITVRNGGNAVLVDLAIRVLLLDPVSGAVVGEIIESATLNPGDSVNRARPLSTAGLTTNKTYLAVLLAAPGGSGTEQTLDSANLTIVNSPPDCSSASVNPGSLWPPNHKPVEITIGNVTDPEGDLVTVKISNVFQDERTDDLGSGDTCPDALGVGTSKTSVRAERSGRQNGRVYHIVFAAEDGRGGRCESEVTVCVPRDGSDKKAACVDEGALFDSTVCP